MASANQFCYYSKPIEFLLYVNFKSGKRYVNCDIYNDIHDILTTIKSKILMKMNEFDMETTTFEQLDVMCDTIDNDIRQYSQTGISDTYSVIDKDLKIIEVIEEQYVNIKALKKYNINFIIAFDYINAKEVFLRHHLNPIAH